jgi:hypothetical protein
MNQSDPLELVGPGTLTRPGPVGRLLRLGLGALCLFALWNVVLSAEAIVTQPFSSLDSLVVLIAFPLFVFNYVVNIGFSKSWGRRPLIASLAALGLSAGIAFLVSGSFDSPIFGVPLTLWLGYFYAHLGIAFVLAAFIATPGCEMRSIPEAIGRVLGKPSEEHLCPASFVTKIDAWEQRRVQQS